MPCLLAALDGTESPTFAMMAPQDSGWTGTMGPRLPEGGRAGRQKEFAAHLMPPASAQRGAAEPVAPVLIGIDLTAIDVLIHWRIWKAMIPSKGH